MLNRTFLYLKRKKGKTIILFLLVFLISTFVVTSLALKQTAGEVSTVMRESLGGQIELRMYQQLVLHGQEMVECSEIFLTDGWLREILEIPGIIQHNARQNSMASGLNFVEGFNSSGYDQMGSIHGMNESKWLPDFSNGALELTEGRHIASDNEHVVLISEVLALTNGLNVGDTVRLLPAELGTNDAGQFINTMDMGDFPSVQATVIGIFTIHEASNEGLQPTVGLTVNQIFSDTALLETLGLANYGFYNEITFHVGNPSHLPEIMERIRETEGFDEGNFFMQYNDFGYERISRELQTMQNLILILLAGIGFVSMVILSLILVLRMRGRIREVGTLLSVGIRKSQIWGGFLLEIALVSLVAFVFSHSVSINIVPVINRGMLAEFYGIYEMDYRMALTVYAVAYLSILGVVLATTITSTLLTVRLKPKQILSIGS